MDHFVWTVGARRSINVGFLRHSGNGGAPAVPTSCRLLRWRLSLHSVDFVDGRNIPEAVIGRPTVYRLTGAPDHVCYLGQPGRFRATVTMASWPIQSFPILLRSVICTSPPTIDDAAFLRPKSCFSRVRRRTSSRRGVARTEAYGFALRDPITSKIRIDQERSMWARNV